MEKSWKIIVEKEWSPGGYFWVEVVMFCTIDSHCVVCVWVCC